MDGITRRSLLAGAGALGSSFLFSRGAHAAEITLKLGHDVPESHTIHKRVVEAVANISRESGGRIAVQVFSNSQLGSSVDMLSQVRSGALELQIVGAPLGNTLQIASINATAFAFPSTTKAYEAMDGELGDHVRKTVAAKLGIVPFDKTWDFGGFRQITTSSKPIQAPGDLQGMKLRVPVTPLYNSTFRALGASPVSINYAEVYSALQTGVADGQENPLALIEAGRFYEVQKYCSLSNHIWETATLVANAGAWEKIPADLQAILRKSFGEAAVQQRQDAAEMNSKLQESLAGKGLVFNSVDPKPFQAALSAAGYYTEWQRKFGDEAWALLERYSGKLA